MLANSTHRGPYVVSRVQRTVANGEIYCKLYRGSLGLDGFMDELVSLKRQRAVIFKHIG